MWKETKVVKNVEYYNFDARFGVYATTDRGDKSILHIGDKEIALNKVLSVRSYGDKELVFGTPHNKKWHKALERIGVNPKMFSLIQGIS